MVLTTTVADPGAGQARQALEAGCDRVVVAGGDGTVREVAGVLAGTQTALGIVPCGTANLAARGLGVPLRRSREAVRRAVTGAVRPVDLGTVTLTRDEPPSLDHGSVPPQSQAFLVVVGVGHDAEILAALDARAKTRLSWLAYLLPGIPRLRRPARPVSVGLDGADHQLERAWSVLAVNHARLPLGARVVPGSRADDGLLHLVLVAPTRVRDWWVIARTGLRRSVPTSGDEPWVRRSADDHPALRYRSGSSVTITLPEPGPVQVDGDVLPGILQARIELAPGALLVAGGADSGRMPGRPARA